MSTHLTEVEERQSRSESADKDDSASAPPPCRVFIAVSLATRALIYDFIVSRVLC